MDERAIPNQNGKPIPAWDLQHRLPIDVPVGSDCWDGGTIFRINSTYMDVTEQPYLQRQWTAAATFIALFVIVGLLRFVGIIFKNPPDNISFTFLLACTPIVVGVLGFGYLAFKSGRDEFFGLKRRPIRFNREQQKIYTVRRRRFFCQAR
ncbi:DUF6708 domain-containing protein [Collimonas arenae]|uniref:DUF6708 domain-containing protein n=1 Tax=Collimonas arenae TaxID=279058 RepID=UPI0034608BA3